MSFVRLSGNLLHKFKHAHFFLSSLLLQLPSETIREGSQVECALGFLRHDFAFTNVTFIC